MHIVWLNDSTESFIGDKAKILSLMASKSINIPKGFVITHNAFAHFLNSNNIDISFLENLNLEDQEQVMHASEQIQQQLMKASIPEELQQEIVTAYDKMVVNAEIYHQVSAEALNILKTGRDFPKIVIRPSTHSKEAEALFNIKGKEALLQGIKKSWMSFFQAENLQHKMNDIEIIVQKMISVEKSGVVSEDENLRVEAVLGLYESVINNLAQPDVYLLDEQGIFLDKHISKQDVILTRDPMNGGLVKKQVYYQGEGQKINDYDVRQIVKLYQKIKSIIGEDYNVAFAYDSNQLHVLNAENKSKEIQVVEQALQNPKRDEPEPESQSYTDEIHTVTELRAYLDRPEGIVSSDGIFTLASLNEVKQIAQENQALPIWYSLLHADELATIMQFHDEGLHNIGIAIAGMTELEQLRNVKKALKKAGLEPLEEIELGVVIDAPALTYVIDDIDREGVDFLVVDFSLLGERSVGIQGDGKNKGYLKLLHHFVKECKLRNIEVGVAGTTFDDELIDFFVKAGFDSIIVPKMQIEDAKKKIARAEKRLLLNVARKDLKEI